METQILLHFLKFNIQSHSLDVGPWVERLYATNDISRDFPDKSVVLTLRIERKSTPHAFKLPPPVGGTFAETNLCAARCTYKDGRFFSANESEYWHELEFLPEENLIRANLSGKYLESAQWIISNFIRPILQSFILPFYGIKTLHGGVLSKGKQTVFLSGQGGMGKSTTTLQLIQSGWDVLSDDGPFFFMQDGEARVLSSLDYIHVTDNTLNLFPEMRQHVVGEIDNRQKYALRRQDIQNSEAWKSPQRITDFIELKRGDSPTARLVPGDRGAVFRSLFNDTMIIFRRPALQQGQVSPREYSEFIFKLVTSVVQDARVHRLEFANQHLSQLPELIESVS